MRKFIPFLLFVIVVDLPSPNSLPPLLLPLTFLVTLPHISILTSLITIRTLSIRLWRLIKKRRKTANRQTKIKLPSVCLHPLPRSLPLPLPLVVPIQKNNNHKSSGKRITQAIVIPVLLVAPLPLLFLT